MDFVTAVRTGLQKYATFAGRTRRSEFWYFWLFLIVGNAVTAVLDSLLGSGGVLEGLFSLATLLPHLAVTARRLHDTGRSGWWQVAYLAPVLLMAFGVAADAPALTTLASVALIATLVLLVVWLVRAGDTGPNRFGEEPAGAPLMPPPV